MNTIFILLVIIIVIIICYFLYNKFSKENFKATPSSSLVKPLKHYQVIKSDTHDITQFLIKTDVQIRLNDTLKDLYFIEDIKSASHNNKEITFDKEANKDNNIFVINLPIPIDQSNPQADPPNPDVITIKDLNIEFVLISKDFKDYLKKIDDHNNPDHDQIIVGKDIKTDTTVRFFKEVKITLMIDKIIDNLDKFEKSINYYKRFNIKYYNYLLKNDNLNINDKGSENINTTIYYFKDELNKFFNDLSFDHSFDKDVKTKLIKIYIKLIFYFILNENGLFGKEKNGFYYNDKNKNLHNIMNAIKDLKKKKNPKVEEQSSVNENIEYYEAIFSNIDIFNKLEEDNWFIYPTKDDLVDCDLTSNHKNYDVCYKIIDNNKIKYNNKYINNSELFKKCEGLEKDKQKCETNKLCIFDNEFNGEKCVPKAGISNHYYNCRKIKDKKNCENLENCFFVNNKCFTKAEDLEENEIPYMDCNYFNTDAINKIYESNKISEYCPRDFCKMNDDGRCVNNFKSSDTNKQNIDNLYVEEDIFCELINNKNNNSPMQIQEECNVYKNKCKFIDSINDGVCVNNINQGCILRNESRKKCENPNDNSNKNSDNETLNKCKFIDNENNDNNNICIPYTLNAPCTTYNKESCPIDDYIDIYGKIREKAHCKLDIYNNCVPNNPNITTSSSVSNKEYLTCLLNPNYENCKKNIEFRDTDIKNIKIHDNYNVPCSLKELSQCSNDEFCEIKKIFNTGGIIEEHCLNKIHYYDANVNYKIKEYDGDIKTDIKNVNSDLFELHSGKINSIESIQNDLNTELPKYELRVDNFDFFYNLDSTQTHEIYILNKAEFEDRSNIFNHTKYPLIIDKDNYKLIIESNIIFNNFSNNVWVYKKNISNTYQNQLNLFDTNLISSNIVQTLDENFRKLT